MRHDLRIINGQIQSVQMCSLPIRLPCPIFAHIPNNLATKIYIEVPKHTFEERHVSPISTWKIQKAHIFLDVVTAKMHKHALSLRHTAVPQNPLKQRLCCATILHGQSTNSGNRKCGQTTSSPAHAYMHAYLYMFLS